MLYNSPFKLCFFKNSFGTFIVLYKYHLYVDPKYLHHPKINLISLAVIPHSHIPWILATTDLSVSIDLPIEWSHVIFYVWLLSCVLMFSKSVSYECTITVTHPSVEGPTLLLWHVQCFNKLLTTSFCVDMCLKFC